jgi:WD40 repeat protein
MRLPRNVICTAVALILVSTPIIGLRGEQDQSNRAENTSTVPAKPHSLDAQNATKALIELKPCEVLRYMPLPPRTQAIALDRRGGLLVAAGGGLKDPTLFEQKAWLNGETQGSLSLISTNTGRDLRVFDGSLGAVFAVALSPDRKLVATGGRTGKPVENGPSGGEVILWDVATKRERTTLFGHTSWVTSVAFSPDGKLLATAGLDHTVKVWDVLSGKETVSFPRQTDDIGRVAFSADGRILVTAMRYGGGVKLWDTRNWTERAALADKADFWFDTVFSPDSKILALTGGRRVNKHRDVGEVKLLTLVNGELETLFQRSGYIFSVAFSPDGRRLAAVVDDRTVVIWDLATKNEIAVIKRHIASGSDQVFFLTTRDEVAFTSIAPSRVEIWKIEQ